MSRGSYNVDLEASHPDVEVMLPPDSWLVFGESASKKASSCTDYHLLDLTPSLGLRLVLSSPYSATE
jgi:hypothetical protein